MGQIDGVILSPLKRIFHPKGDIYHAMKKSDVGFSEFGEAYFSTVNPGETKGWKKHLKMTMNLVVPFGAIEFVILDDRSNSSTFGARYSVALSAENYQRLTVPSDVWVAFKGLGAEKNILLNLANIEHVQSESINKDLSEMPYEG